MGDVEKLLKAKIRSIPDYPKKGILFRDITPMLKDSRSFSMCVRELARNFERDRIEYVAGIEARGFILGGAIAEALHAGFIPIRKKGKLPYQKVSIDYELEYNIGTLEMHSDAVEKGNRVLIVDDLLATGGTAKAAAGLLGKLGAEIAGFAFVIELTDLDGRKQLDGEKIISLVKY